MLRNASYENAYILAIKQKRYPGEVISDIIDEFFSHEQEAERESM